MPATSIVFDGDDTLWETEPLYDISRARAAEIAATEGLDPIEFERLQRQLDVQNVAVYGLSSRRFPTSCVEAYEALAVADGRDPQPEVSALIFEAASFVFRAVAPVYPGAGELLATLSKSYRLGMLTKGELEIQKKRIADSGLAEFFLAVRIVDEKDSDAFLEVCRELGAEADQSWSIGNSFRSDVKPALELGMHVIWIDQHVWEHERHSDFDQISNPRLFIATHLAEAQAIIDRQSSLAG